MSQLTPRSDHEQFEQLCALMAIGELTDAEQRDLQEHLTACQHCQEIYVEFCKIGSEGFGLLAAQRQGGVQILAKSSGEASEHLERIYHRLGAEKNLKRRSVPYRSALQAPDTSVNAPPGFFNDFWRRAHAPDFMLAAVAVLLCVLAIPAYQQYEQVTAEACSAKTRALSLQIQLEHVREQEQSATRSLTDLTDTVQRLQTARALLERDLADAIAKDKKLEKRSTDLTLQFAKATAQAEIAARDLQQLRVTVGTESQRRTEAENRLQVALQETRRLRDDRVQALLNATDQKKEIASLEARLSSQSASIERTQAAVVGAGLTSENLFGARNLHIVDVYDVDGEGKTKRTFGRVYYVEKKLLVFYAFDLHAKRRNQFAASFQAWGYREIGSSKPENLGLFRLDDASASRWALKVDDPRVLEHIDTVFVTLEPLEGSPTPKGRRVLYANLAGAPNHP